MDAAAIEQMNKVRASLGLAPLPVPGASSKPPASQSDSEDSGSESDDLSTLDKRTAAAGNNWQKLEAERLEKNKRQMRKDAAKKARDASQRFAKLQGKGLGEANDDEELDTRSWLLQQKKRQKKIDQTRKVAEERALREQRNRAEYTAKDLAGVSVAHEIDDFDDAAGEHILTLKDAEIGSESEDDELENAEINAKQRLEEKLRLKKKRPDYDPTEQEESRAILSKYDEEIDGKKTRQFALDGKGTSSEAQRKKVVNGPTSQSKGVRINLDLLMEDAPVSDYLDSSTIKIKKPKKKKDKQTRQKGADDDYLYAAQTPARSESNQMEIDGVQSDDAVLSKKRISSFDDEDLQAQLAESRRQILKRRKKMDASELARQIREEVPPDDDVDQDDNAVLIDETSEFVANLKGPDVTEDTRSPVRRDVQHSASPDVKSEDEPMEDSDDDADDGTVHADMRNQEDVKEEATATGLDDEQTTSSGNAATLAMLRKRGLIETSDASLTEKETARREFLAGKQHLIDEFDYKAREQREADRSSGRLAKLSNREREAYAQKENERREAFLAKLLAEKFNKEYKPDVKLTYHDEFGRSMNQKEAFKHMSHMFHGKGSGKQKTEKRLKKINDEKKDMAKGMLNIGDEGGMAGVQGREGKRQKQAGVRLQ